MKVLLFSGSLKWVGKSGIGEALQHQKRMLEQLGIPYTVERSDTFDVIHLNTVLPDSLIISKWAKWNGKRVIYFAHSTMEDFKKSFRGSNWLAPIFKCWIKVCYNSGDIIITPSVYAKNILESYGLKKQIFSLSNGVDTVYYKRNLEAYYRFRMKYHLKKEAKVIISVGHYIERKGILDFIKLAEMMPEYQFYWFGSTNLNLITKNVKMGIAKQLPNLHFPGYVSKGELRDVYCGSDLFLFLTNEETEGIVLLEALASEIPILVRDIPIYSDWLIEDETVYKGRTIPEFQQKIVQIIEGTLPLLTKKAHQLVMNLDLKIIGEKLSKIYEQ